MRVGIHSPATAAAAAADRTRLNSAITPLGQFIRRLLLTRRRVVIIQEKKNLTYPTLFWYVSARRGKDKADRGVFPVKFPR